MSSPEGPPLQSTMPPKDTEVSVLADAVLTDLVGFFDFTQTGESLRLSGRYIVERALSRVVRGFDFADNQSGVFPDEVTPEMIEAGRAVLDSFEWGEDNPEETVAEIYHVMVLASLKS